MSVENEVRAAASELVAAFGSHDTTRYFDCFAEDASFLFHTTGQRLESRRAYQDLWASWEREGGFHVHGCVSRNQLVRALGDDAAVFCHDVSTDVTMDGARSTVSERETIVFQKGATGWLAVHEHLSALPDASG